MNDYGYYLRQAYFNVLTEQVVIDSGKIPVVDEKLDQQITEHDIYIKLSTQNDQQQNNKCYFAASCELRIDIVQRTRSAGGKMVVDSVADQILMLLFPTSKTTSLVMSAPWQLSYARFENSNTSPLEATSVGFIQVKTLVFTNRVAQTL